MKYWRESALVRQWQQLSTSRRTLLKAASWGLSLIVIGQLLWLPGQARLQKAERDLAREHELSAQLQRIVQGPPRSSTSVEVQTPAGLNERAKAAGLRIISLEASSGQVDVSLEGGAVAVLAWLHRLEQEGGKPLSLQLQAEGELLQARFVMMLAEA
ncbi:type II secretion system protein GspM [Pseudomonas fluorescens]|uniref:type II secretion system protein GspM n=1 Tax=Pseudomonas fluorescens TaxID=294 RepID=UPI0020C1DAD0|nr:type II secretion system protein GspM [Pseudomonas fluorescens]UTL91497.1 type II secretion system protein M [Pseudomonas fluorescens]